VAGRTVEPGRSVVSKLAAILTSFSAGSEHSLNELVHWTGLPMSTTHRLLHQLVADELLQRTDGGGFAVSSALRKLSDVAPRPPTLHERAAFVLDDLAYALHRRARLGVRDNLEVAYIEKSPGHLPVTSFADAARLPAHATAIGKALLAFAPPEITRMAISSSLPAFTARTAHRPDQLYHALDEVRRTGYAVDRGELRSQTHAVAVPVLDTDSIAIAAIEIEVDDLAPDKLADLVPILALAAHRFRREVGMDFGFARPAARGEQVDHHVHRIRVGTRGRRSDRILPGRQRVQLQRVNHLEGAQQLHTVQEGRNDAVLSQRLQAR
jgi:IclR family transcriptional regulator, acetate operon repressor